MRKIALLLALVLLLTGCASQKAYIPTGDGLADVTRPAEAPTEPPVTAPGGLNLTESGREIARKIYERHTLLTKLLIHMGVSEEIAAADACKLEHAISDESFQAIKNYTQKLL